MFVGGVGDGCDDVGYCYCVGEDVDVFGVDCGGGDFYGYVGG